MAAEGMDVDPEDVLVTTGGQQVIDLVCKTLVDPGDVIVAEAPTYPGAVPAFSAYQADVVQIAMDDDGMRIDELEETLERLEREGRRPKFIYTIPTFQNPAGVTMSLPRRQRLVQVARERELLVLEDNPYGLLRYEGEALPTLRSLDGGDFVIYLGHLLEDPLPRHPPGLDGGARAGAREDEPRQAGQRPVLVVAVAALRGRVLRRGPLAGLHRHPARPLPPPARHDARRAGRAPAARGRVDAPGRRALHLGHAARLHRHDRPARPRAVAQRGLRPRARGLPRRPRRLVDAAELLRRRRRRHPRGRAADRRGRARAGRALRDAHRRRAAGRARPSRRPRRSTSTWPTCCTSRAATIAASAGRDERRGRRGRARGAARRHASRC